MTFELKIKPTQLALASAAKLPHSHGHFQLRFELETDKKVKIAAITIFVQMISMIDSFIASTFKTKKKWVKLQINNGTSKTILLNINSLCKRTHLSPQTVSSLTPSALAELLSKPIEVKPTKLSELFPNAFLINLDRKPGPERLKTLDNHLNMIGQKDFKFTRMRAIDKEHLPQSQIDKMSKSPLAMLQFRDDRPGRLACLLSHLKAIKKAKEEKLPSILILEDDVRFKPEALTSGSLKNAFQNLPKNWDIFFLGYQEKSPLGKNPFSEHLAIPRIPHDLHAYVVNQSLYDDLIETLERELKKPTMRAVDEVIADEISRHYNVFACRENIAFQDEGASDIRNKPNFKGNYQKEVVELKTSHSPKKNRPLTADGLPVMHPLIAGSLYQMTAILTKILDREKIPYDADGNTIEAMEKYQGLIPWQSEVEFCIPQNRINLKLLHKELKSSGITLYKAQNGFTIVPTEKEILRYSIEKEDRTFTCPKVHVTYSPKNNFTHLKEEDFGPLKLYKIKIT